jgi:hypothetical protein
MYKVTTYNRSTGKVIRRIAKDFAQVLAMIDRANRSGNRISFSRINEVTK